MTDDAILLARVERDEDGTLLVRSPALGLWSDLPQAGALLEAGGSIGALSSLNHRSSLALPLEAAGRVEGDLPRDRAVAVEYGQVLFHLAPVRSGEREDTASPAGPPARADVPPGSWGVVAPTDGIFYAAPSPGVPPFVHAGARIVSGQPIGLVEVMKTFNQILYGGVGLPEEAEVVEIRCGDREEIRAGQVLIVVR